MEKKRSLNADYLQKITGMMQLMGRCKLSILKLVIGI